MNLRYIIFDFDGTICDSYPAIDHCLEQTFLRYELVFPSKDIRKKIIGTGKSVGDSIQLLHLGPLALPQNQIDAMVITYRQIYSIEGDQYATLYPGAYDLLNQLHSLDIVIIVASNKGINSVKSALETYGLREFIDDVIGEGLFPDETLRMKPDPMIFDKYIKPKYPLIDAQNGMMVGDTDVDIRFAKNCNLISCWAAYGYGDEAKCLSCEPDYIVKNLSDLTNYIFPTEIQ